MNFDSFVLAASTGDVSEEPAAREHADVVEFRMDRAESPLEALDGYSGALPLLATNRPTWEGGERQDDDERARELEAAIEIEAVEAVDVELGAIAGAEQAVADLAPVVEKAVANDVAVVVSAHDFDSTPSLSELAELGAQVCTVGDVGKIAVTPEDPGDVLDLLRVTYEFTAAGRSIATMAMGTLGAHSRAVAPLYGSKIGYAPVDPASSTAPGQYDLATLARLVADLQGDGATETDPSTE